MKLKLLALLLITGLAYTASAQLGKLKKPKIELPKKPSVKPEEKKPEVKQTTTTVSTPAKPAVPAKSVLDQVKAEQEAIETNNQMVLWDNTTEEFGGTKTDEGTGYLSFIGDYTAPDKSANAFSGKDFIYARLQIEKPITSYLPDDKDYDMEYYRLNLKATINGRSQENNIKLQQKSYFELGYNTNDLLIAVLPEKGFFESITENYKEGGKFTSAAAEHDAYCDITSRNFSRQMAYLFKDLPVGQHKVSVEYEITAKMKDSDFKKLENLKGVFVLDVDEEAQQRFSEVFDMLTNLYKEYEEKRSIASQSLEEAAEEEMLAKMTSREKERYLIAKRAPTGYMAAYEGERSEIYFSFGDLRTKNAYIDIVWPDGGCDKCEAGTSSIMVTKANARKVGIPKGAKVTINGKTLVSQVSGAQNVKVYWYY